MAARLRAFLKQETVLCISALCAAERAAAERTIAKHGAGFVAAVEDFTEALWREYEACLQQAKE